MPDSITHPWDPSCPYCIQGLKEELLAREAHQKSVESRDRTGVERSRPLRDPAKLGRDKPTKGRYPRT